MGFRFNSNALGNSQIVAAMLFGPVLTPTQLRPRNCLPTPWYIAKEYTKSDGSVTSHLGNSRINISIAGNFLLLVVFW
jgi:hypothetical protein